MEERFNNFRLAGILGLAMSFIVNFQLTLSIVISILLVVVLVNSRSDLLFNFFTRNEKLDEAEHIFFILFAFASFTLFTVVLYNLFTN